MDHRTLHGLTHSYPTRRSSEPKDTATTHMYVQADLAMKEQALMKLQPGTAAPGRFRASDNLMSFLKTLRGLIPYEYICKCWTTEPERFKDRKSTRLNSSH